ncbi:hypothetical protein GCM10023238_00960 [Streptomyces heliomycini]
MITVDLPGYGSSDFLPAHYDIDFLADAVQHMLTEVDMPEVNLFGGCFGEVVGLRFAQRHPESVRASSSPVPRAVSPDLYTDAVPRLSDALGRNDIAGAADGLVRLFMSNPEAGRVRRHAAVARLLQRQFTTQTPDEIRKAVEHNTRLVTHGCIRTPAGPRVPTLMFTGEYDTLCTRRWGVNWPRRSGARFTTVTERDHLVTVERREESADLIARFCTDRPIDGLRTATPSSRRVPSRGRFPPDAGHEEGPDRQRVPALLMTAKMSGLLAVDGDAGPAGDLRAPPEQVCFMLLTSGPSRTCRW